MQHKLYQFPCASINKHQPAASYRPCRRFRNRETEWIIKRKVSYVARPIRSIKQFKFYSVARIYVRFYCTKCNRPSRFTQQTRYDSNDVRCSEQTVFLTPNNVSCVNAPENNSQIYLFDKKFILMMTKNKFVRTPFKKIYVYILSWHNQHPYT